MNRDSEEEKVWLPNEALYEAAESLRPIRISTIAYDIDLYGRGATLDFGGNVWYDKSWWVKNEKDEWQLHTEDSMLFYEWKKAQTEGTQYRIVRSCIPYHAIQRIDFDLPRDKIKTVKHYGS